MEGVMYVKYELVFYVIKPGLEDQAEMLLKRFVTRVEDKEPGTMMYKTYRQLGGRSFYHIMQFKNTESEVNHKGAEYTQEFYNELAALCEQSPVSVPLDHVSSIGAFEGVGREV